MIRSPSRKQLFISIILAFVVFFGVYIVFFDVSDLAYWGKKNVYWPILATFKETFFNPLFLLLVPLYLLIQHLFPAQKDSRPWHAGLAQDFVYVFIGAVFRVMVTAVWVGLLTDFYAKHLDFLTVKAVARWPEWLRLVWGILLADFVFWSHHWVRHKVPWFWEFHAIHHSQKQMNMFTDDRYHFIEYVIENFFNVLILSMFAVGVPEIVYFAVVRKWYTRFYHSSIRTNFGFLKYILVTPQSHRVHHSIEPKHRDKNFGVLFSLWDHLFGTQWRKYDEYPDTGITDPEFPHDSLENLLDIFLTPVRHLVYPFQKIIRAGRNKKG